MKALVDTGATTSAITAEIARRLDLTVRGKRLIVSAHGDQHVNRYVFRVGIHRAAGNAPYPYVFEAVEGFEIRSVFLFDAILGMDILAQCDLTIAQGRTGMLRFG